MSKQVIATDAAPKATGPYSQAVEGNGIIYVSGQLPLDPKTGTLTEGDIEAQAKQALQNLQAVLESAGLGLEAVVKTTLFLVNLSDFQAVNSVYAAFFKAFPPARSTAQVTALPRNAKLEIEAVAVRG